MYCKYSFHQLKAQIYREIYNGGPPWCIGLKHRLIAAQCPKSSRRQCCSTSRQEALDWGHPGPRQGSSYTSISLRCSGFQGSFGLYRVDSFCKTCLQGSFNLHYTYTRSLGALRVPTSSWWPFGPVWLRPSRPSGAQAASNTPSMMRLKFCHEPTNQQTRQF